VRFLTILFLVLCSYAAHALPDSNGKVADFDRQFLNYGSVLIALPDAQKKYNEKDGDVVLHKCKSSWGFPVDCTIEKSFKVNEKINVPSNWYFVSLNSQRRPVFVMPENRMAPLMVGTDDPTDQMFELGYLSKGLEFRTELEFKYRNDYRDPNMFLNALFELNAGFDTEFSGFRTVLKKEVCTAQPDDNNILNLYQSPEQLERIRICQAVASSDPSNLADAVLRVNANGQLEARKKDAFVALKNKNEVFANGTQTQLPLSFQGSYLARTINKSMQVESENWAEVKAGSTYAPSIFQKPKSWKALTVDKAPEYLLVHQAVNGINLWRCPSSFQDMIGASPEAKVAQVESKCTSVRANISSKQDLQNLLQQLQQRYERDIVSTTKDIETRTQERAQLQANIATTQQQKADLEKQKSALEDMLKKNAYFVAEQNYLKFQQHNADLQKRQAEIVKKLADLKEDYLAKSKKTVDLWALGIGIVAFVGAGTLAIGAFLTPASILGGVLLTCVALVGGGAVLDQISIVSNRDYFRYNGETIERCLPDMKKCTSGDSGESGNLIREWLAAEKTINENLVKIAEIERFRTTDDYRQAKEDARLNELAWNKAKQDIAALVQKIADLESQVAAKTQEIQALQASIHNILSQVWASSHFVVGFEQLLADAKKIVVRDLACEWPVAQKVIEDIGKM